MKKILGLLLVVCSGLLLIAADTENYCTTPAGFDIGTNSLMIAAPRKAGPDWQAGASYAHGDRVRSTNDRTRSYWNVSGTLTDTPTVTMPTHAWGDATDSTTNVWRRIMPRSRIGIEVVNNGPGTVWLACGHNATVSNGIMLVQYGSWWPGVESFNDSVYAITTGTTTRVTTQEY